MLTREDLQALSQLIDEKIGASENRMMAYIESHVEKDIRRIADGHLQLSEKMDRMEADIKELKGDVAEIKGALVAQDYINAQVNDKIVKLQVVK